MVPSDNSYNSAAGFTSNSYAVGGTCSVCRAGARRTGHG